MVFYMKENKMTESKIAGVQCCVCKKFRIVMGEKEEWLHTTTPEGIISHTYCPACYDEFMKEFEKGD